jgi:transposase
MGHRVRLIPAQYVKPFVKRSKNDRNDAQPISEAAARPGMQEVAVKSADAQARAMPLTVRELLAWLGLVPREISTGGKQRLGGISRAGNERLRQLLVPGATAGIRFAKPGRPSASAWLLALLARKPRKLAAVALANKMAQIIRAMLTRGEDYRSQSR